MKAFACLPDYLYYSFRDYLSQDDYQQLLNTSKMIFSDLRRKTIIYYLTREYSIKYCEDEKFRNQLLEKAANPSKQIYIKLNYLEIQKYNELFDRVPVYLICTSFPNQKTSTPYTSMQNIKEFTLSQYTGNTPFLNLSQCVKATYKYYSKVTDISVMDISVLKDCEDVRLICCGKIMDFRSLGKQRSLSIINNAHLTNVMNFRSIRTLILNDCRNLVDISPLHGVYDLSLISCSAVSDISSLGGHHRLEISWCSPELSGYHVLKDIPIVKLGACNISDVSVLSNAKVVHLEDCNCLVDVSALKGVRDLTLRYCEKIEDISMLTTVRKLTLCNLPQLKKYEGINELMNLSLQDVSFNHEMFARFPNVKNIECYKIPVDKLIPLLPSFTNLHSLTFYGSASIVEIEVCIDIHTVIIEHCEMGSIRGLGRNRVVRLISCRGNVLDVSPLATVPLVSIIECIFKMMNYESLQNVPRLKVSKRLSFDRSASLLPNFMS